MTAAVHSFADRALQRPMGLDVRRRLEEDIRIVFRMLNRSDWVREFILGSNVSADLLMLLSPLSSQSSFILDTEEHQEGRLTGSIRLRYLVVPSFSTPEGLSGGAVVTSYARRNHPLHRPNVMATTRTGRYIRDNISGEWLIITRNESDNVTRLQWLHSSKATTRERICLTCNTSLFNKGMFVESILFECHDEEWRPCPQCHAPPETCCECSASHSALVIPKHPLDLPAVAAAALGEPKSEWFGRVQVSVLSNLSRDLRGDVDACMQLRTSFEASQDAALAAQMQNLALAERAKGVIPRHVLAPATPKLIGNGMPNANAFTDQNGVFANGLDQQQSQTSDQHLNNQSSSADSNHALELLSRSKMFSLDAVVPEIQTQDEKAFPLDDHNNVNGMVMNITADTPAPQPNVFDPMAVLMPKQMSGNSPNISNDGLRVVPGSVTHQQQHAEQLANSNHLVLDSMTNGAFAPNAPSRVRPGQNSASTSSHSSREDEDENGALHSERLRMPATKAFDTFLHNFMNPHTADHSAPVDVGSLDGIDIAQQNGWLNPEIQSNGITKESSESNTHDAQANRVHVPHPAARHAPTSNGTLPPSAPQPTPQPMIHVFPAPNMGNGVRQIHSAPPPTIPKTSTSPVTPVTVIMKNPVLANGHSDQRLHLNGGQNYHHHQNGAVPIPTNGHALRDKNMFVGTAEHDGGPAAPLARLEPRPPGMAAGGDAAWMWHMGPRGPFGMAAIAAARERERRAEERRRKNREAAARSNARAKERILAIKGELEKNKNRISRLTTRKKELEMLNSSLKRQLPMCVAQKEK